MFLSAAVSPLGEALRVPERAGTMFRQATRQPAAIFEKCMYASFPFACVVSGFQIAALVKALVME